DPVMLVAANRAVGTTLFWVGAVASAHTHLAQGLALYDPQQHHASMFLYGEDTGVVCRSHAAHALWSLGYPDQGLARNEEAVTLAQHIVHPPSLCYVLSFAAFFHQFRREGRAVQERAESAITLATQQGFTHWRVIRATLHGWALAHQGWAQEGIEQLRQGIAALRATGAELGRPYLLALLAEAYGIMGQPEEGLTVLTEALTLADTTGVSWYE